MIARAAVRMGKLDADSRDAIIEMLYRFGLPTETEFRADELYELLLLDKKISSGKLALIVPLAIGWSEPMPVNPEQLRQWLEAAYD
jgi:3-dehydroquinate synthetase